MSDINRMSDFLEVLRETDAHFFVQTKRGLFPKKMLHFSKKTPMDYLVEIVGVYKGDTTVSKGYRDVVRRFYTALESGDMSGSVIPEKISKEAGSYKLISSPSCASVLKIPVYSVGDGEHRTTDNEKIAKVILRELGVDYNTQDNLLHSKRTFQNAILDVPPAELLKSMYVIACSEDSTYLVQELTSGLGWIFCQPYALTKNEPLMPALIASSDIVSIDVLDGLSITGISQ